jgi:hypothetical protein
MNFQLEALPIASSPFNSIEHLWGAFRRCYNKRLVLLCMKKKCPKENILLALIESAMEDLSLTQRFNTCHASFKYLINTLEGGYV